MKQGDGTPTSSWVGNPQGGVSSPDPIILPDPARRFRVTAARLADLSEDHPMADWLMFLCNLSQAQGEAAAAIAHATPGATLSAADEHSRHPAWREALRLIVGRFRIMQETPDALKSVAEELERLAEEELEELADDFLGGTVAPDKAGQVLFVAAALQVYFTCLAAGLDVDEVRLLDQRGLCPCCGSTPVAGVVTASGNTPGVRYLYCSLCSTAWNHVRAVCVSCGQSGKVALRGIEGEGEAIRAETCDDCHSYSKLFYLSHDADLDAYADDLASLGLDIMVSEAGWARHAPNPLLLGGSEA